MQRIIAPIRTGDEGETVANLQAILQYFLDHNIIILTPDERDLLMPGFGDEVRKRFYGEVTATLVVKFRMAHALGDVREVDEPAAQTMNDVLDSSGNRRAVKGLITSFNRRSAAGFLIKAFNKNLRSTKLLGESITNDKGEYEIVYYEPDLKIRAKSNGGLLITVFDENGLEIISSPVNYTGEDIAVIDLTLPDRMAMMSEYERMVIELESMTNTVPFQDLTAEDIRFLSGNSGFTEESIRLLRDASITALQFPFDNAVLAGDINNVVLPVPIFYGWFRQGLETDPLLLFAHTADELEKSILNAISASIIPDQAPDLMKNLRDKIGQLATKVSLAPASGAKPSLGDVLNTIPEPISSDAQVLVADVLRRNDNPETPIAEKLKKAGLAEKQIQAVEKTLILQSFSGNFLPLIKILQKEERINSLKDLALQISKEELLNRIVADKAHPDDVTAEAFAGRLYNSLFQEEPTAVLRNMLGDAKTEFVNDAETRNNVSRFLANIPDDFNIKTTSVMEAFKYDNAFRDIAPDQQDKVRETIKSIQRIAAVSPVPEAVPILLKSNLGAAFLISNIPQKQFVSEFQSSFGENGEDIALQIHELSSDSTLQNELSLIHIKEIKKGTGIAFIDSALGVAPEEHELYLDQNNLSWDLLFGQDDFCESGECNSVYSAAAYYVDLLQFLRNNNLDNDPTAAESIKRRSDPKNIVNTPLDRLLHRRPDLGTLQLTCKNTNTILPYADLVNEILENYTATQQPLASSFNVEDETTDELLSQPQHTNLAAYKILKDAVYPFTLPYHEPIDAIRIFLKHLGSSRSELMDTFVAVRSQVNVIEPSNEGGKYSPDLITYNQLPYENLVLDDLYKSFLQRSSDAEFLGLAPEEYSILTKEAFVSKEYWDTQYFVGGNHGIHTVAEYQLKIGIMPVGRYYGYASDQEMLSLTEPDLTLPEPERTRDIAAKTGLFFVKNQFLPRTGISFADLTSLLKTQFINPDKQPGGLIIIGDDISLTDSCDLDAVRLKLGVPAMHLQRYDRIHRFIRLWRKLGWSMDEVDQSITSEITPEYLHQAVAIKKLVDQTGLELSRLLVLWNNINTVGENSLYKRLFLTHNLLAVDPVFQQVNGSYLAQQPKEPLSAHLPVLMAALNLSSDDILAIKNREGNIMPDELTIGNVSQLFRYRLLSAALNIPVTDLIGTEPLFGDVFADPHATLDFIGKWRKMEDAGFDYRQLNYLVRDKDNLKKPVGATKNMILDLAKTIYNGITAIDAEHGDLKADPKTTDAVRIDAEIRAQATTELVGQKASLYYDQDTVAKLITVLDGTAIFSAPAPPNIKDRTRQIRSVPGAPPAPPEFENLKLENYPLLNDKIKYDAATGSVQVKGILTAAEEAEFINARRTAAGLPADPNAIAVWQTILDNIKKQQSKLFSEVFKGIFANEAAEFVSGDVTNLPIDPQTNIDSNTPAKKRSGFLKIFMPYLRRELSHRVIIDSLAGAAGTERTNVDILITEVLKIGAPPVSVEQVFQSISHKNTPNTTLPATTIPVWSGIMTPVLDEAYTFIIKGFFPIANLATPEMTINDVPLVFEQQTDAPGEWWGFEGIQTTQGLKTYIPVKLKSGRQYDLLIKGISADLENLFWKTNATSVIPVPYRVLLPQFAITNTATAFAVFQKAAILAGGFNLKPEEIEYFARHPDDFDGLDFNEIKLEAFLRLSEYARLRNALPVTRVSLLDFLNWSADAAADISLLEKKIAELTNWRQEKITQLIDASRFSLRSIDRFRNAGNLLRLQKAMDLADMIGLDIKMLFDCASPLSAFYYCHDNAERIRKALRSKYKQDDWQEVVKPLNDQLRGNQKNALISFLLVQSEIRKWGVADADGLFEYFLIDVQMDVCMETSRIKQAISSVQLFIQRCFLDLESQKSGITPSVLDRTRWEWMQRYRLWEANRKIFLYPENWIESDLRDDKSPFFKELESELLQKDINRQNIEDALKSYLYKVDEVANLEIVGLYIDGISATDGQWYPLKLHVFGRTRKAPYFFYYRYLDIAAANWYPWEKMQLDISSYDVEDSVTHKIRENGCYLTPVVWTNRLLVFFPQFMKKTRPAEHNTGATLTGIAEKSPDAEKPIDFWEIKMAWSEYRNGKWTQKQLSQDVLYDDGSKSSSNTSIEALRVIMEQKIQEAKNKKAESEAALAALQKATTDYLAATYIEYNPLAYIGMLQVRLLNAATNQERLSILGQMTPQGFSDYKTAAERKLADAFSDFNSKIQEMNRINNAVVLANAEADTATQHYNDAVKGLYNIYTLTDISLFKFLPVFSNNNIADRLLGLKVLSNNVEIGIFEFNGSNISNKTQSYFGETDTEATNFHHKSISTWDLSYIRSFQDSPEVENYTFIDGTLTTFARFRDAINFYHPFVHQLIGAMNSGNMHSLFRLYDDKVLYRDKGDIFGFYSYGQLEAPDTYHELKSPYAIYNWELLFHAPVMLADALSKSQQFEESMKWYHFIFNPMAEGTNAKRFWQFIPFKEMDSKQILSKIFNSLNPNEPDEAISEWRSNPFKPHLVARSRPVAYMKWVVMKYIDNLIAWGDYLFRQDTIESINQATQIYVLARHILGKKPEPVPRQSKLIAQTYNSLLGKWDAFSNAMAQLELALPGIKKRNPIKRVDGQTAATTIFGSPSALYFSIPYNPKLSTYWETISDRLFKIRHCENIEGVFRKLPLFEPPIDPALLVRAAAQGLSIASVLNDLNTPMPNYRFYYLLQKALELCSELKSMGGAMLSAIEKKDNEAVSLIRAKHETGLQNLVMEIKKQQLDESRMALESLQQSRKSPEHRMRYYLQLIGEDAGKIPGTDSDFSEVANPIEMPVSESGLKLVKYEKEDMDKANEAQDWQRGIGIVETTASIMHLVPDLFADVKPFGIGAGSKWGGINLGNAAQALARGLQVHASDLSFASSSAGKKAGFLRAMQERVMQANAAGYEIKQIDKQILSQQIRIDIANKEIANQQQQIDNTQEMEEFLKNKYSNEELYNWMKGNLNAVYHQVYNLAFDLSKKAEKVYRFERGLTTSNFIQSGYWDTRYDGLLSGEQLFIGLKQLEAAYHESRSHDYEITRNISLKQISPMAIVQVRQTGKCEFFFPESLFDMDFPGHYKRRIKSVSVSVPCISGPYTSLNGTLRLLEHKFRNSAITKGAGDYQEKTEEDDNRFNSFIVPISSIATSTGQNDAGMFELNFKDERYLPFEGAGLISKWRFELPEFRQFNYDTISDIIVHVRYTALEGGNQLKNSAKESVARYLKNVADLSKDEGLYMIIDLKHDMPNEWYLLKSESGVDISIEDARLPYFSRFALGKKIEGVTFMAKFKDTNAQEYPISLFTPAVTMSLMKNEKLQLYLGETADLNFNMAFKLSLERADLPDLEAMAILVKYSITVP